MNRNRIIELAVETGVSSDRAALESATKFLPNLERFAKLIAAEALRETAAWFDPYDPTVKTDSRWMHVTEELRRMADEMEKGK